MIYKSTVDSFYEFVQILIVRILIDGFVLLQSFISYIYIYFKLHTRSCKHLSEFGPIMKFTIIDMWVSVKSSTMENNRGSNNAQKSAMLIAMLLIVDAFFDIIMIFVNLVNSFLSFNTS